MILVCHIVVLAIPHWCDRRDRLQYLFMALASFPKTAGARYGKYILFAHSALLTILPHAHFQSLATRGVSRGRSYGSARVCCALLGKTSKECQLDRSRD